MDNLRPSLFRLFSLRSPSSPRRSRGPLCTRPHGSRGGVFPDVTMRFRRRDKPEIERLSRIARAPGIFAVAFISRSYSHPRSVFDEAPDKGIMQLSGASASPPRWPLTLLLPLFCVSPRLALNLKIRQVARDRSRGESSGESYFAARPGIFAPRAYRQPRFERAIINWLRSFSEFVSPDFDVV